MSTVPPVPSNAATDIVIIPPGNSKLEKLPKDVLKKIITFLEDLPFETNRSLTLVGRIDAKYIALLTSAHGAVKKIYPFPIYKVNRFFFQLHGSTSAERAAQRAVRPAIVA